MKKTFTLCVIGIISVLLLPSLFAQSTHQFRGNDRSGHYNGNIESIASQTPKLLWKVNIGAGFSEIVVDQEKLYTTVAKQLDSVTGTEQLAAFDAKNGNTLWKQDIDSMFFDQFGNGARSTPIVTNERIYCLSSYGKLTACAKQTGKILWQVDLLKDFGSTLPRWAFSTSPVLVDDVLIAEVGGSNNRAFVGFNPKDGSVIWQKGQGPAAYSSPLVATLDGKTQVIFASATTIYSFSPKGDSLWAIPISMNGPMAMPVLMDNQQIFISTVRSRGYCVVEVKDGIAKEILQGKSMKNDYSSCVFYNKHIYGFNVATLACIDPATNTSKWVKRGLGKGSLIQVGSTLIALSDKGKVVHVSPDTDAYKPFTSYQALTGKSWTAPTFAEGKLYLRNLTEMACYEYNAN